VVGELASASNADNGTYFFFDLFDVILNKQRLSYKSKLKANSGCSNKCFERGGADAGNMRLVLRVGDVSSNWSNCQEKHGTVRYN
jgi:hypothetical protein